MKKMSLRGKILIASVIGIIILVIVGIFAFKKVEVKTIATTGKVNNQVAEEQVIEEVKEEVIVVPQDNTIGNLEDKIPVIKVASMNDKEDPEKLKKKGGKKVSQDEAITMFENTGVKSYGIDVSSNNGSIDWAAVKASGVDFAIIRAGFRGYVTGEVKEDPLFKTNARNASANGIKVGAYFYSAAVNETEALEEAITTVRIISTSKITYPVAYDSEEIARAGHRTAGVSGPQAASNANTFINHVRSNGYEGMVYANISDMGAMGRGNFSCKYWLAHYVESGQETTYKGSHQMWQYTSKGSVPGINGNVDMDIAYFSYGTEAAAKHEHKYTEVVKNSHKDPTCTEDGEETLRCSCGDTEKKVLPKTGHKLGAWQVRTPATEENEGLEYRKCTNKGCSYEETRKIEKLKPVPPNTNTNTNTAGKDNTEKPSNNTTGNPPEECVHEWEWKIDKEATCKEKGIQHQECKKCDAKQAENTEIEMKEHSYGDWQTLEDGTEERTCSECGITETKTIEES